MIDIHFGKNFEFHPNLDLKNFSLKIFSKYYQEKNYRWSKYLSSPPSLPSSIASQFLCLNKDIQIDNKCVIFSSFSNDEINFIGELFYSDGKLHCWEFLKEKYLLSQNTKLNWFQLIQSYRGNGKKLFQYMMAILKIFSFKTIISSRKTKCLALPNLTIMNCTRYKL